MSDGSENLAEITVKAVVLGVLLSVILAAANAYLGLFAGMTVSASIPAAVVSMGILRMFRKSSILENNIVQTAASAGESLAAGVIFTLPAMVILGHWDGFGGVNYIWVTVIAGFGGLLGVLFTIPLRRALIVEEDLKFPEGVATAEVLETGREGGHGLKVIAASAAAGGLFKLGAGGIGFWPSVIERGGRIGGYLLYGGMNISPALLSVGYIVGLNIAVLIFIGGALNWYVAIPLCAAGSAGTGDPVSLGYEIWSTQTRYIGVGGMLTGGLWTVFRMRRSLFSGIKSGLAAYRSIDGVAGKAERTERDISMKWVLLLVLFSVVPLFVLYQLFTGVFSVSLPMSIVMIIAGFLFSAVAGYMAGLVGSSNNPISGITIATIVAASLLLVLLMGREAVNGPPAAIIIGSVVCCAAAIAGDNMQDLKAGRIVGATPWKQQVMQMVGTLSAALVMAPVLMLLHGAYGFKGQPGAGPAALTAAQANLMASVAAGVFRGEMPWNFTYAGMLLGVLVIGIDLVLEKRGSGFRVPVLAVAIGFYLPVELSVPILAGGIVHSLVKRGLKGELSRDGLLFASGLITGEALMGILIAVPVVLLKKAGGGLPLIDKVSFAGEFTGILLFAGAAIWLYKAAVRKTS